jgi:exopolysaccharide biosynthesis protein
VLAGLLVMRGAIERQAIQSYLERLTGAKVAIGAVRDGIGVVAIDDVHLESPGLRLDVPLATARYLGPPEISLERPAGAIVTGGTGDPMHAIGAVYAWLQNQRAHVVLRDGSLIINGSSSASAGLHLGALNGDGRFDPDHPGYDFHGDVEDSNQTYPFEGHAKFTAGTLTQEWSADALPLAPLFAAHPGPPLTIAGGIAQNVSIKAGASLRASADLHAVIGTYGVHRFSKLHGALLVVSDRLGSSGINGTFDDVPFSIFGEAHDLTNPLTSIVGGTRDLRAILRMVDIIAAQPNLRFVHIQLIAPGVVYGQFAVTSAVGPHVIQLVTADPAEPSLHFDTAISSDHVISKGERTSDLAVRTGAIAGLNGDYFDIGRTYEPQGLLVRNGTIVRGPTDRAALLIDRNNKVSFNEFSLAGTLRLRDRFFNITQVNTWPAGDVTVITPDYGSSLRPADGVVFARLEPVDAKNHEYRISAVETADHELPVSLGIAFGPKDARANPKVGDPVTLQYSLTPAVDNVVAGIGGGPILLRNGEWYEDPHAPAPDERDVRWPVDALGVMGDGTLVLVAVDGRHPERSVGMTRPEFADLLKSFGVTDAMALDSGGSVTLVARTPGDSAATLHNKPSDNSAERYISDALLLYSSAPPNAIVTTAPSPTPEPIATASP